MQGKKNRSEDCGKKMIFEIGNIKRVGDFIKGLNDGKVALLSHTDLDGLAAAKVAAAVLAPDFIKLVGYSDLNDVLIEELKKGEITKIVMTDLMIESPDFLDKLSKFADVLIIDHHTAIKDFNNERVVYMKGYEGYCAAYLVYDLFSRFQNLENYDWLVASACVSDYCHVKPMEWLKKIYAKYGDEYEQKDLYVRREGFMWDLQWNISLALVYYRKDLMTAYNLLGENPRALSELMNSAKMVQKEVDHYKKKFETDKEEFKDGYFFLMEPKYKIVSLTVNGISEKYPDKTLLVLRPEGEAYAISARRQDRKISMNDFLKKMMEGFDGSSAGGHIPASGGWFPKKYLPEFRKRLGLKS